MIAGKLACVVVSNTRGRNEEGRLVAGPSDLARVVACRAEAHHLAGHATEYTANIL